MLAGGLTARRRNRGSVNTDGGKSGVVGNSSRPCLWQLSHDLSNIYILLVHWSVCCAASYIINLWIQLHWHTCWLLKGVSCQSEARRDWMWDGGWRVWPGIQMGDFSLGEQGAVCILKCYKPGGVSTPLQLTALCLGYFRLFLQQLFHIWSYFWHQPG